MYGILFPLGGLNYNAAQLSAGYTGGGQNAQTLRLIARRHLLVRAGRRGSGARAPPEPRVARSSKTRPSLPLTGLRPAREAALNE
jgi:hypothetical protein